VDPGAHTYATTFVTAAGETTGSPISAPVTTYTAPPSPVSPPATTPTLSAPDVDGPLTTGYGYAVTFATTSGETTGSAKVTGNASSINYGGISAFPTITPGGSLPVATYQYGFAAVTARGQVLWGTGSVGIVSAGNLLRWTIPSTPYDPRITGTALYRTKSSGGTLYRVATIPVGTTSFDDNVADGSMTVPAPSTDPYLGGAIVLSNIPTSADGRVSKRRIYRTNSGGSTLRLVTTINNNTTTSYTDATPDGSLGATIPTADSTGGSTTLIQTVPLTGIAVGPAGVTARRLYRTPVGGAQLYLVATIADNVTTTYADTTADASLGAPLPALNTTVAAQVALAAIAIGGTGVTGRRVYRTAAGAAQLKLVATLADNTTATYVDTTADAALGANLPTSDTSGLVQPNGQVSPGSPILIVASPAAFAATGGWAIIGNGQQVIRYSSRTANALTGIPVSGPGAIVAAIGYNSTVTAAPALTGVTGIGLGIIKGSPVNIWVQRDDVAAQIELATRESTPTRPSDGIREYLIVDERRGEASLQALCDADLLQFSRGIRTVPYAARDVKIKVGKPTQINLASPPIAETLTIQEVTIDQIDEFEGLLPRFTVTASNFRHSLEDLLRRVAAGLGGL
jgi:hypothetical protein